MSDVQAPKTLWLKEGVPVLLIRNPLDRLVNGLLGTVHKLTCDEIIVKFESIRDHVVIHKVLFEGKKLYFVKPKLIVRKKLKPQDLT